MRLTTDFYRALADYRLTFPDLASLGVNAVTWLTERARVARTARAAVLIVSSGTEGGSASGQRQFDQGILIDALDWLRHEYDATYALPGHLVNPRGKGMSLQFEPLCRSL